MRNLLIILSLFIEFSCEPKPKVATIPSRDPGSNADSEDAPVYNPDLIEIEGQSNGAGSAPIADLPADLTGPMHGVNVYNHNTQRWETLEPNVNNRGTTGLSGKGAVDGLTGEFGIECRLMKLIRAFRGRDQYLIKYCISNTPLAQAGSYTDWSPRATKELFARTNENVRKAIQGLADKRPPRLIIWFQGENDANNRAMAAAYQTNLEAFIAGKRAAYGYDIPFIIIRLGDNQRKLSSSADVIAAQNAVGAQRNNYLVSADGCPTRDDIHYNADGIEEIAQRVYKVLIKHNHLD